MLQLFKKRFLLRGLKYSVLSLLAFFLIGMLWPQSLQMPVAGANEADYNPKSFWHYPWGKSVVHHGVDIFARKGTRLNAATNGLVLSAGNGGRGGRWVVMLGPKWRMHYYAHLETLNCKKGQWISARQQIGTVGNSGNAEGKPAHLHYSIISLVPMPWRIDSAPLGWRKMFFLNPIDYLSET